MNIHKVASSGKPNFMMVSVLVMFQISSVWVLNQLDVSSKISKIACRIS